MKVAINNDWGGFSLDKDTLNRYNQLSGKSEKYDWKIKRNDKHLIQAIEEAKKKDKVHCFIEDIKIVEISDDVEYEIHDYDGMESIHEVHRSWS